MFGLGIPFVVNVGWIIIGEDNWCPLWNHYQIFKALFDFFLGWKYTTEGGGGILGKKMCFLGGICWGAIFCWLHLVFWQTCKMNFDTKASNIILVIFQMKLNFQQNIFFQFTLTFVWMKNLPRCFLWIHMSQTFQL
jgi:hypothetical protein